MKFSQHKDTNLARIFLLLPLILQYKTKKPFPPILFGVWGYFCHCHWEP
ncbi:hypothetical protein Nmel_000110 [Mimus melanotis]